MSIEEDQASEPRRDLTAAESLHHFNNALQVSHSLLRLMERKLVQQDVSAAQALATTLHDQLTALRAHGLALSSKTIAEHPSCKARTAR